MKNSQIVIQTNLQVLDTPLMDPERLVKAVAEMGADALVYNVGGIYAWYSTKVPYHTVNPYLPTDSDLLKEVIAECHRNHLQFIARFDFSKAEDKVYFQRPWWFVKTESGEPLIIGEKRPGDWSLLFSTCLNSDYRAEAVAIPVLEEVISRYDIDGIFFNSPNFIPCFCQKCREKYQARFGAAMPDRERDFHPEWSHLCVRDNIQKLNAAIKAKRPDLSLILYYANDDKLAYRMEVADEICAEPQDILSLGHLKIPEITRPILHIKKGRTAEDKLIPYGIIHSSPGMDWRHTGLPTAEYEYWLSLITASGGNIWHSLTGFAATITDKRIINTVTRFNQRVKRVGSEMDGALSDSQLALLWDASPSAAGIANGLVHRQIPFDLILGEQFTLEALKKYQLLIMPENSINESNIGILIAYVHAGGRLLTEGAAFDRRCPKITDLLGIAGEAYASGNLTSTYLRFEGDETADPDVRRLRNGFEVTEMIPLRGIVGYCSPQPGAKVLLTQVPPFAPLECVGAPPERASLLVKRTDIPMLILSSLGLGKVLYLPFSLSGLIDEFRLAEHYNLLRNLIDLLLGEARDISVTPVQGLYVSAFKNGHSRLVHLVNGAGSRPLIDTIPLHDIKLRIKSAANDARYDVTALISGQTLAVGQSGAWLEITLPRLDIWECLKITRK